MHNSLTFSPTLHNLTSPKLLYHFNQLENYFSSAIKFSNSSGQISIWLHQSCKVNRSFNFPNSFHNSVYLPKCNRIYTSCRVQSRSHSRGGPCSAAAEQLKIYFPYSGKVQTTASCIQTPGSGWMKNSGCAVHTAECAKCFSQQCIHAVMQFFTRGRVRVCVLVCKAIVACFSVNFALEVNILNGT